MTTKQTVLPFLPPLRQGSFLSGFAMTGALGLALGAALTSTGCKSSRTDTALVNPGAARSRGASQAGRTAAEGAGTAGGIRTRTTYKQAVAAYHDHHYAEALRHLDTLCATPNLTEQDKAFLERQRVLCNAAITGKPATMATLVPTASASNTSIKTSHSALSTDCGPRALLLLCNEQHVPATLAGLTKAAHTGKDGTSMDGLTQAAQAVGFHTEGVQMDKNALENLSRPAIAWVDGNHYVAVLNVHNDPWTGKPSVTIHDPNKPEQEEIPTTTLLGRSGGILLMLSPPITKKPS